MAGMSLPSGDRSLPPVCAFDDGPSAGWRSWTALKLANSAVRPLVHQLTVPRRPLAVRRPEVRRHLAMANNVNGYGGVARQITGDTPLVSASPAFMPAGGRPCDAFAWPINDRQLPERTRSGNGPPRSDLTREPSARPKRRLRRWGGPMACAAAPRLHGRAQARQPHDQ